MNPSSRPGPSFGGSMQKRKYPSASPGVKAEPGVAVKVEPGREAKRPRPVLSASHGAFKDPRTAAAALVGHLKSIGTMGWQDAYFHVQNEYPEHEAGKVLEILKGLGKIQFNEVNNVFSYIPDLTLKNQLEVRNHIRAHSTTVNGLPVKDFREALPPGGMPMLEELEKAGNILIMKALSGSFKDLPLPKLGEKNALGFHINDAGAGGGYQRFKMVFWDDMRERSRTGTRVDQDFISAWDNVDIPENADVGELLEKAKIGASSVAPPPQKILASGPVAKKKKKRNALKITNTHMKSLGIDFSKDYDG